jgi:hypothetical protein
LSFKVTVLARRIKAILRPSIILIFLLTISIFATNNSFLYSYAQNNKQQVNLTGLFVDPEDRWNTLIPSALRELKARHPDLDIRMNYTVYP